MTEQVRVPSDLISYLEAMKLVKIRYPKITFEEFAMWVFFGGYHYFDEDPDELDEDSLDWYEARKGGFKSYFASNADMVSALALYKRVDEGETIGWEDIRQNLHLRLFSYADLSSYDPPDRWLSYSQVVGRWPRLAEADVEAKLMNLTPKFPVRIVGQEKTICMYALSEIETAEEKESFTAAAKSRKSVAKGAGQEKVGPTWQEATIAIAEQVGNARWNSGTREITVRNMADEIATKLGKNKEHNGQRGPRSASGIRKALIGWRFDPPDDGSSGASGAS